MIFSKNSFLDLVGQHASDHLKGEPLRIYAGIVQSQGKDIYEWNEVAIAIKELEKINKKINIAITKDKKKQKTEFIIDQTEDLKRDFLIDKISPWVENIRIKLFRSSEPPFDWDGAVEWIEAESEKHKEDAKIPKDLINRIKEVEKKISKYYASITRNRQILPYAKKDEDYEWKHNVYVSGPNLVLLEKETQRMAKATGFPQSSLVIYVLTGKKPSHSRASLTARTHCVKISDSESILRSLRGEAPEPESLIRNEAILTIRSKDFNFKELLKIYKKLKESLSVEKEYSFSENVKEKYSLIYNFMKDLKLPSTSSKISEYRFWINAHTKWNKRHLKYKYDSWRGLRKAHKRIISKLES